MIFAAVETEDLAGLDWAMLNQLEIKLSEQYEFAQVCLQAIGKNLMVQ